MKDCYCIDLPHIFLSFLVTHCMSTGQLTSRFRSHGLILGTSPDSTIQTVLRIEERFWFVRTARRHSFKTLPWHAIVTSRFALTRCKQPVTQFNVTAASSHSHRISGLRAIATTNQRRLGERCTLFEAPDMPCTGFSVIMHSCCLSFQGEASSPFRAR